MRVPHRLKQGVGEAEGKDVLDRLLAEIVVDTEYRVLVENALENLRQLACRLQVGAKRLLNHDAMKAVALREACVLQLLDDGFVRRWRGRAVVNAVAAHVPGAVELFHLPLEGLEVLELAEVDTHVKNALKKCLQDLRVDGLR